MRLKPCIDISPTTRPPTLSNSLLKAGFELILEEDAMVYRGKGKDFKLDPEVNARALSQFVYELVEFFGQILNDWLLHWDNCARYVVQKSLIRYSLLK